MSLAVYLDASSAHIFPHISVLHTRVIIENKNNRDISIYSAAFHLFSSFL